VWDVRPVISVRETMFSFPWNTPAKTLYLKNYTVIKIKASNGHQGNILVK
jgi:hypothetical protein